MRSSEDSEECATFLGKREEPSAPKPLSQRAIWAVALTAGLLILSLAILVLGRDNAIIVGEEESTDTFKDSNSPHEASAPASEDTDYAPKDPVAPSFTGKLASTLLNWPYGKLHMQSSVTSDSEYVTFAIHGVDLKTQNAGHWKNNLGLLQMIGSFFLVDLPGFGETETNGRKRPRNGHALAVRRVVEESGVLKPESNAKIILLARNSGARVTMDLLAASPDIREKLEGLILIEPAVFVPVIPEEVKALKTLLIWAENDPRVPLSMASRLTAVLREAKLVTMHGLTSSIPERERPGQFAEFVLDWMKL